MKLLIKTSQSQDKIIKIMESLFQLNSFFRIRFFIKNTLIVFQWSPTVWVRINIFIKK